MNSQITNQIMMIRPTGFRFNEETAISNDYQQQVDMSNEELLLKVQKEFDQMVEMLKNVGIKVHVIEDSAEPIKPDAIFPNNWISMHEDGRIFLYPMKNKNRSAERRPAIINYLKDCFKVKEIIDLSEAEDKSVALEGTGSMIFNHQCKKVYACLSPRTDEQLLLNYAKTIGYEPIVFNSYRMNGSVQYHTNVVMCIGKGFCIICLDSIENESERETVKKSLMQDSLKIIEISRVQLEYHFAGNMLHLQGKQAKSHLVMSKNAYSSLTSQQITEIQEFADIISPNLELIETVGGGSARCMMAEIFLTPAN